MLDAVGVGGTVVLGHYLREGEVMAYEELHQCWVVAEIIRAGRG